MSDNLKDDIRTAIPIHKKIELKEVERLQKEVLSLQKDKEYYKKSCDEYVKRCDKLLEKNSRQNANIKGLINAVKYLNEQKTSAKAEAVKEFAERYERYLLSQLTTAPLDKTEWINFCLDELDNLKKEMVGEK